MSVTTLVNAVACRRFASVNQNVLVDCDWPRSLLSPPSQSEAAWDLKFSGIYDVVAVAWLLVNSSRGLGDVAGNRHLIESNQKFN